MPGPMTYLITGGARSGKSRHAQKLTEHLGNRQSPPAYFYIATGWAGDKEMQSRIERHQQERGSLWTTIEEQLDLPRALKEAHSRGATAILVDCLTLWTSNLMYHKHSLPQAREALKQAIEAITVPTVFVTNEVGLGIVPESKLGREFRDEAGWINQLVGDTVDRVTLVVCGQPLQIKG